MESLFSLILEVGKCIMKPSCNYVEHHRNIVERMDNLRGKRTQLRTRKNDIEMRIQTEVGSDQEVKTEVRHWLGLAEAIITEIQNVEEKFQNVSFMRRGRFSKRVQRKIVDVDNILESGKFPEGIAINKPQARGMTLPTDRNAEDDQNRVKFRQHLEETIIGHLTVDDVGIIGVYGPGGVGKTTLAKSINNKMSNLEDSKFNKVIWAPLPYPFSIVKLQDIIAGAMGESLPEDVDEDTRAAKLFEIMRKVKFLLILDDAWERFSFECVGIPVPTADNGCKVVITSRSTQLCKYLRCDEQFIAEPLSEEESFNLFLDTVGRDVILKDPNLEEISRDLVKECAGLPLAVVVIARSMKTEDDISGWRNALYELRNCVASVNGWDDEIFNRLKFSYDRLKDEEHQNCFLFCSLYGKRDIEKEELIESWIDGGLITPMRTRKAMADRARSILNRLLSDCLIEDLKDRGYYYAHVRMHDVLRDMALRVTGSRFMVKGGEEFRYVTENGERTEHLEKVSIIGSGIWEISRDFRPNCPKLSTLLLSESGLGMIPDSFFMGMLSLEYLDLSGTWISALPNSISNLTHLTTLLLRGMERLKYVPSLAGLKKLKKLDLNGARITVVPEGIEVLVNLQYLDLNCPYMEEFPIQKLKDLSHLQFFSTLRLTCQPSADFVIGAEQLPSRLQMLETFKVGLADLENLSNWAKFFHPVQKHNQYLILVGDFEDEQSEAFFGDTVECCKKVIIFGLDIQGKHSVLLPNDLQHLEIGFCGGMESLNESSLWNAKADLRSCVIDGCSFQCILDLGSPSSVCSSLFDKCEVLSLSQLYLHALVKEAPQARSALSASHAPSIFSNIKRFELCTCEKIKKLFPSNLLKELQNLEEIHVNNCEQMEEIIELEEETETLFTGGMNEITVRFKLVKLRILVLSRLPNLKSICPVKGVMVCDSLQAIRISKCPKLSRIPLHLPLSSPPPSVEEIKLDSRATWEVLEWDNPSTKEILLPFLKLDSDASSLTRGFDGVQDFNNFVRRFQDMSLTSYEYTVEANDEDVAYNSFDLYHYYANMAGNHRNPSKNVILSGVQINADQIILLPNGLQCLEIRKLRGMKSLCEFKTAAMNLTSCLISQCGELECLLELSPSSSACSLLEGLQSSMLGHLPNLLGLLRMENQATLTPSTSRALTPPSIFSNLKEFVIYKCLRIKKLFPSELSISLQNLQKIIVSDCAELEEIIEMEEEKESLVEEKGENEITRFALSKLKVLVLVKLPKLKRICTPTEVMGCDSLEKIAISECEMLRRIPLDLPLLPDGQLRPPPLLKKISTHSTMFWESLLWDKPSAKNILDPFLVVERLGVLPF